MRLQAVELLAQVVIQRSVGDSGIGLAELHLIAGAAVIQSVERAEGSQGRDIAAAERVVQVEGAAQTLRAGVATARVVGIDAAAEVLARSDIHDEIRRTHGGTRDQRGFDVHARQVRQLQQPAFKGRDGDGVAAVQAIQQLPGDCIGKPALVA